MTTKKTVTKATEPTELHLTVVGMQYRLSMSVRRILVEFVPLRVKLVREPENSEDQNAIAVFLDDKGIPQYNGLKLGYLRRQVAEVWAQPLDKGSLKIAQAHLTEVYPVDGAGELLVKARGAKKTLEISG